MEVVTQLFVQFVFYKFIKFSILNIEQLLIVAFGDK